MAGKEKKENKAELGVAKDILESLGGIASMIVDLLLSQERRISDLEGQLVDLSGRVDRSELREGVERTSKIAEGTLTGVPELPEVSL